MVSNNYYLRPSLLVSKILDCLEVLVNIQPFFDSLHSLTAATMQSLSRPHLLTQRKWPLTQGLAPETGVSNKIVELCLLNWCWRKNKYTNVLQFYCSKWRYEIMLNTGQFLNIRFQRFRNPSFSLNPFPRESAGTRLATCSKCSWHLIVINKTVHTLHTKYSTTHIVW